MRVIEHKLANGMTGKFDTTNNATYIGCGLRSGCENKAKASFEFSTPALTVRVGLPDRKVC
jgi:hypothetical protein